MKNKTQLSVRPVRKSKKPGYPSWQEPNPLEQPYAQPYAQPYPFTQKAINWLAASGLCGALFLMPEAEGGVAKKPDKMERMDKDTLGNPFPFEKMGVPFRTSPFGTGQPSRISSEEARAVIDSVFRAEGFRMERKVVKAADGLIELNGYDAEKHIGYVYVDFNRMEHDMALFWQNLKIEEDGSFTRLEMIRFADRQIRDYDYSIKKIYAARSQWSGKDASLQRFLDKLKQLIDNGEPDWDDSYRFLYYEYILEERIERIYKYPKKERPIILKYMEDILALNQGAQRKKEMDIAMDVLDAYTTEQDWLAKSLIAAAKSKKAKVKLQRLNKLQEAYRLFEHFAPDKSKAAKQFIIEGKDDWKPAAKQVSKWLDAMKININEAKALENDAYENDRYIALISSHDYRLTYTTQRKWVDDMRGSGRFFYKRDHPDEDSLTVERNMDLLYGKPDYSGTKETKLELFKKEVLNYIRWAKQQRGY